MRHLDMTDPIDRKYVAEQCAATLVCLTADSGEVCLQFQMNGVQQNGVDIGDWVVSVEHIPAGKMN